MSPQKGIQLQPSLRKLNTFPNVRGTTTETRHYELLRNDMRKRSHRLILYVLDNGYYEVDECSIRYAYRIHDGVEGAQLKTTSVDHRLWLSNPRWMNS